MKNRLLIPVYLFALISVGLCLGFDLFMTVPQLLSRMERAWSSITDYQADIYLSTRSLHDNQEDLFVGQLTLKPMHQLLKFEYQQHDSQFIDTQPGLGVPAPKPDLVSGIYLGRGSHLSKYDKRTNTVEHTVGANDQFVLLLGLLVGMGSLDKDEFLRLHDVKGLRRETIEGVNTYRFLAQLKQPYQTSEDEMIRQTPVNWNQVLWIDRRTYLPIQAQLIIPNEREITIAFRKIQTNPEVQIPVEVFQLPDRRVVIDP